MKVKVDLFGIGAGIPATDYGIGLVSACSIKFILSSGEPKLGDMWYAYSMAEGPTIDKRSLSMVASSVQTEWFQIEQPSIHQHLGGLERWSGEVRIRSPFILSRNCNVKFTAFNPSGLKVFDFHVTNVKCYGIQLGSTTVRGTLIRHFKHSHPTIQRQIQTGTIGQ